MSENDSDEMFLVEDYDDYSEGSNSDPEVDLENQYYNSKALKDDDLHAALKGFEKVLELEKDTKGEYGFKALKQMMKINFKINNIEEMMKRYNQLLTYIKGSVTRNESEKAINSILDYVGTLKDTEQLQKFYEITLSALSKTSRLWFKTTVKLGHLYYDTSNFKKLSVIINELRETCITPGGDGDVKKATELLEIHALEIQMYSKQRDFKKLRNAYSESLNVKGGINHPVVLGIIRECGGKMHLELNNFDKAYEDFFESFKNYDEASSPRRIKSLKYLVFMSILMKSTINPFDSQEAKPYVNDPELASLIELVKAYENHDVKAFAKILKDNENNIMDNSIITERIEDLLKEMRKKVLLKLIKPYTKIRFSYLCNELEINESQLELLIGNCIFNDFSIQGRIDQVNKLLILDGKPKYDKNRFKALDKLTDRLNALFTRTIEDFETSTYFSKFFPPSYKFERNFGEKRAVKLPKVA